VTRQRLLQVGDPAPWFECPASNNPKFKFNTMAGRYIVLCFFGSSSTSAAQSAIKLFTEDMRLHFNDTELTFFGISVDAKDETHLKQQLPGIRYFWDFEGKVSYLYGASDSEHMGKFNPQYTAFTLVLDPLLRVIARFDFDDINIHHQQIKDFLIRLPDSVISRESKQHAPVLILPRVFEPELCRTLIATYEKGGGSPSGFVTEKGGYTVFKDDPNVKKRQDFDLTIDASLQPLLNQINATLNQRLVPEIFKSFQFKVTHIERYIVACYDGASGGFFRPHRDNTTPGTLHRRFAVTINLNTEEYSGGDLRFPEFGSETYRAPTGGAVVFSCSLLHEATAVTQGKRYAFLPFLYDEVGAKIRLENIKYVQKN
jgi:peroxiredoxin/predicted 2-oxoglutarate/Fe(II)-dependent dioxygenase YbiX